MLNKMKEKLKLEIVEMKIFVENVKLLCETISWLLEHKNLKKYWKKSRRMSF